MIKIEISKNEKNEYKKSLKDAIDIIGDNEVSDVLDSILIKIEESK